MNNQANTCKTTALYADVIIGINRESLENTWGLPINPILVRPVNG